VVIVFSPCRFGRGNEDEAVSVAGFALVSCFLEDLGEACVADMQGVLGGIWYVADMTRAITRLGLGGGFHKWIS
jgi:hypothetical protein